MNDELRTNNVHSFYSAWRAIGCQLGARWCLASSLTCDFNMIKNYTHDWLLLVAAYHASYT